MPNYQLSKIYKLYSPSKNLIYIGSTTQALSQRLASHLRDKKIYDNDNSKNYCSSYLVLECEDYKIELIEEYPCNNKTQLEKKEGEYQKNNKCVNKFITGRSIQEYYIDNADKIKEKKKQYRLDNADKIKEKGKQYYLDNADKFKEKGKQYYLDNADKKREYMLKNADKIKETQKQYNIANKEKMKEYKKQYYLKKKAEKAIQSSD